MTWHSLPRLFSKNSNLKRISKKWKYYNINLDGGKILYNTCSYKLFGLFFNISLLHCLVLSFLVTEIHNNTIAAEIVPTWNWQFLYGIAQIRDLTGQLAINVTIPSLL